MYLEHFQLNEPPFSLTPDTSFFCNLRSHKEALDTALYCLKHRHSFIKITAPVGAGKTLLCRKLMDALDDNTVKCYIPNPDLTPDGLRAAVAIELGVNMDNGVDQHSLLKHIAEKLIQFHKENKEVVLIVDEAQALPSQSLETLRLFTNLETEKKKLLSIVLFGQPELDERLKAPELRQVLQRITYSYYLKVLDSEDVEQYLSHRLIAAGHVNGILFSQKARKLLYKASQGVPRVLNILCDKALLAAYGNNAHRIDVEAVKKSIFDSKLILSTTTSYQVSTWIWDVILGASAVIAIAFLLLAYKLIFH